MAVCRYLNAALVDLFLVRPLPVESLGDFLLFFVQAHLDSSHTFIVHLPFKLRHYPIMV